MSIDDFGDEITLPTSTSDTIPNGNFEYITVNDTALFGSGGTSSPAGIGKFMFNGATGSTTCPLTEWYTNSAEPVFQIAPVGVNNINLAFDAYLNGDHWRSGTFGSNYQISKSNNELLFNYAAGVPGGNIIDWDTTLRINNNGEATFNRKLSATGNTYFGSAQTTLGVSRNKITGTVNSPTAGPNIDFYVSNSTRPVMQIVPTSVNNQSIYFDSYHDGAAKSSSTSSNFRITKSLNLLHFQYDAGVALGGTTVFKNALQIKKEGDVLVNNNIDVLGNVTTATIDVNKALLANKTSTNIKVLAVDDSNNTIGYTEVSGGGGDVSGPVSSIDSRVALFDGTTGKLLKQGGFGVSGSTINGGNIEFTQASVTTNTLSYYEYYLYTTTISPDTGTFNDTTTKTFKIIRVGNMVTMTAHSDNDLYIFTGTQSTTTTTYYDHDTLLPVQFRPAKTMLSSSAAMANGTVSVNLGMVKITTAGAVEYYSNFISDNWPLGTNRFYNFSLSWVV